MADLSDVGAALVALAVQAAYPGGTGAASITGAGVRAYQGWPNPQQLDADLKVGVCHVSVFPRQEERNTTRFSSEWQPLSVNTPTLALAVAGQAVTISGTVPPANNPHNLMISVNGLPYVYAVLASDTLASIATALVALIAVAVPGTTAGGSVVTAGPTGRIGAARVGVTGTSIREIRRQERRFQVTVWANTPAKRDALAGPVDQALAIAHFLAMPDGTAARLIYVGSPISDDQQKAQLYRRDLIYSVEFATTQTRTDTQITQTQLNESPQLAGAPISAVTITTYA